MIAVVFEKWPQYNPQLAKLAQTANRKPQEDSHDTLTHVHIARGVSCITIFDEWSFKQFLFIWMCK